MRISDWSSDVCSSDLFALFMFFIGRRLLLPLGRIVEERGEMSDTMLSIILILFALCAFVMDAAGIHAVFGGFILGACMPRGKLTRSEEHTSELQSLMRISSAVFCLIKKKINNT